MPSDRDAAVSPFQLHRGGHKNTLLQRSQQQHSTPGPPVTFNGAKDPGGKGKNATFQMNVLHFLRRTGSAGVEGITPGGRCHGSLFGSASQSGIEKDLPSFLRTLPILSFFIFPICHQFFRNRGGNHIRETSSNDLLELPGRTEGILDAGDAGAPVALALLQGRTCSCWETAHTGE